MIERHDVVIIGGGQAGLAMSYCLREHRREHVILERARIAERWQSERWNSLCFQFPNWGLSLPGFDYQGGNRDGFAHHAEVTRFIRDYAREITAPVESGVAVNCLKKAEGRDGFIVEANDRVFEANRVVIATGPFQSALIPPVAADLPSDIAQIHARDYRTPGDLPEGAVLVVGTGSSGCQIAEELNECGVMSSSPWGGTVGHPGDIEVETSWPGSLTWGSSTPRLIACQEGRRRRL